MKYMVIAKVRNDYFMTKVEASSQCSAEHFVLDMGHCGHHEYGVEAATAYDAKAMKTDSFIGMALSADPVSLMTLAEIIETNNARIKAKDKAEDRIREIEKQMKTLAEELEAAKQIVAA